MNGIFCVIHRGDELCINSLVGSRADAETHFLRSSGLQSTFHDRWRDADSAKRKALKPCDLRLLALWNADVLINTTQSKRPASRARLVEFVSDNVIESIHKLFTTGRVWPAGAVAVFLPGAGVPSHFVKMAETFSVKNACPMSAKVPLLGIVRFATEW